jgi:hypothetical protein
LLLTHVIVKGRGATGDADVVVLLTDVFGEPLADDNILERFDDINCILSIFLTIT